MKLHKVINKGTDTQKIKEYDIEACLDKISDMGGFVAQTEEPSDQNVLWIDTDDNSGDDYYTADRVDTLLDGKQDLITDIQDIIPDIATIRSNAAKGATAVQPSALEDYALKGNLNSLEGRVAQLEQLRIAYGTVDLAYGPSTTGTDTKVIIPGFKSVQFAMLTPCFDSVNAQFRRTSNADSTPLQTETNTGVELTAVVPNISSSGTRQTTWIVIGTKKSS